MRSLDIYPRTAAYLLLLIVIATAVTLMLAKGA